MWRDPLWRMAARNLRRNPRRSWATGSSVAVGMVGVLAVFGLMGYLEQWLRVNHIYSRRLGHLSVFKHGGMENHHVHPEAYGLSPDEQHRITVVLAGDAAVARVGLHLLGSGLISNGCRAIPFRAVGSDPLLDRWVRSRPEVLSVTPTLASFDRGRGIWEYPGLEGAIGVTTFVARQLSKAYVHDDVPAALAAGPGKPIDCSTSDGGPRLGADANVQLVSATYEGRLAAIDGEIVNLFTTGLADLETDAVATSLTTLQRFYDTEQVTYASVFLRSEPTSNELAEAAHRLSDKLAAAGLSIDVHPWNTPELAPAYVGGMQFLRILGIVALAIMTLLVALTLINNVALSVAERAREIGALRAMGFTARQALGLQLRELMLLVVLAQLAGLGLTALVAAAVDVFPVRFRVPGFWGTALLRIEPSPGAVVASMAVLFVVALTACYIAVRLQLQRRPIVLLQSS